MRNSDIILWWPINPIDQTLKLSEAEVSRYGTDIKLLKAKSITKRPADFFRGRVNTKLDLMFIKDLDNSIVLHYGADPMKRFEQILGVLIENFGTVREEEGRLPYITIYSKIWNEVKVKSLNRMVSPGEELHYTTVDRNGELRINISLNYLRMLNGNIHGTNPLKYVIREDLKAAVYKMYAKEVDSNKCSLKIIEEMGTGGQNEQDESEVKTDVENNESDSMPAQKEQGSTDWQDQSITESKKTKNVKSSTVKKKSTYELMMEQESVELTPENDVLYDVHQKYAKIFAAAGVFDDEGAVLINMRTLHREIMDQKKIEEDAVLDGLGIKREDYLRKIEELKNAKIQMIKESARSICRTQ